MLTPYLMHEAELTLENGKRFLGYSPKEQGDAFIGEVVFTTGMTGYIEALTDPSFAGQILIFTYPLIGNYGVPENCDWESAKIHVSGVVIGHLSQHYSHRKATSSLASWLQEQNIPLITDVDTRALTKELRSKGTMFGTIAPKGHKALTSENSLKAIVAKVTVPNVQLYKEGQKRIVVVDCGIKENILRSLSHSSHALVRVPYDYDYTKEPFDALFISNGPGDPADCVKTIEILKRALLLKKPTFGICLGAQLLALAGGAKTYKLPFGHRGQNQPCIDLASKRCYMTSQNHGYAIESESLSEDWKVTFKNLNDGSVEGIAHKTLPFFAVQFHPEAAPGPTDTLWLFDQFIKCIEEHV